MPEPMSRQPGAYGLAITAGLDVPPELLVPAADDWIDWRFVFDISADNFHPVATEQAIHLDAHRAEIQFASDGWVAIDRRTATSHLHLSRPMDAQEFVHPFLSSTAAIVAWWGGRIALHGACASLAGSAIGLLGGRGQGKSTTLAWLLAHGWRSVADDLLVIDGKRVLAGPRAVDLREETAIAWQRGQYIGRIGTRQRWREVAGPVAASTPLAGLVELEWGDRLEIVVVSLKEKLGRLYANRTVDVPPGDATAVFDLLAIPLLRLIRPRGLDGLGAAMAAVQDALAIG